MKASVLVFALMLAGCRGPESSPEHARSPILGARKTLSLDRATTLELVYIPPGKFIMGSGDQQDERPPHEVTITRGFWMGTTEVTQAQWVAVLKSNPSRFKDNDRLPVDHITWEDCQKFLKAANGRIDGLKLDLPTEAEWEYACRAGSKGRWSFGDDEANLPDFAWCPANSDDKTHPVAQKRPNAWGLHDMHGNVFEWCKDGLRPYTSAATDPGLDGSGGEKCYRGGCFLDQATYLRSAYRNRFNSNDRVIYYHGLRVIARD